MRSPRPLRLLRFRSVEQNLAARSRSRVAIKDQTAAGLGRRKLRPIPPFLADDAPAAAPSAHTVLTRNGLASRRTCALRTSCSPMVSNRLSPCRYMELAVEVGGV